MRNLMVYEMKKSIFLLLVLISCFFAIPAKSQQQIQAFIEKFGSTGIQQNFYKNSVQKSADGHVYVCGATLNSEGNYDMILSKFTSNNALVWSVTYNGSAGGDDYAADLVIDDFGDIIITGTKSINAMNYDAVTIKYNSSGVLQWISTYSGSAGSLDGGVSIAHDSFNNIYICGGTYGSSGNSDFLCAKYNSTGSQQWVNTWDGENLSDAAVRLSADGSAITVIGSSQQTTVKWKMATVRFNALSGAYMASQLSGGDANGFDKVADLAVDSNDNTYVVGSVKNQANGYDLKVIKLNPDLTINWQETYNGNQGLNDEGLSLELTASNDVVVCGYTESNNQGKDFVINKYDGILGNLLWSRIVDEDNGDDEATGFKLDSFGNAIICGSSFKDGNLDYCIKKLNSINGELIWSSRWNGDANEDDVPTNIALSEGDSSVYVGGQSKDENGRFKYVLVKWRQRDVHMPLLNGDFDLSGGYIQNRGQLRNVDGTSNTTVKFYCQKTVPSTYIDDQRISYQYSSISQDNTNSSSIFRLDMMFVKGDINAQAYALSERREYGNFYLGQMAQKAERTSVFNAVVRLGIYQNTDVIFTNTQSGYRHWIVARQGAPIEDITMEYSGQSGLSLASNGDLILETPFGDFTQAKAAVYQMNEVTGELTLLPWQPNYVIIDNQVSFDLTGSWVGSLVIQFEKEQFASNILPSNGNLDWSTFTGGSGYDQNLDVTSDDMENVWVTGEEANEVFSNAPGGYIENGIFAGQGDVMVAKFDSDCILKYFTIYGGSGNDRGWSITHNESKGVFLVGYTDSEDIINAAESGSMNDATLNGISDGLFLELNEFGGILMDSYIGGDGMDFCSGVAYQWNFQNDTRDIWITGNGNNPENFPTQSYGLYNQPHAGGHDGFIMRLVGNDHTLQWCTWFGSEADDFIGDVGIVTSDPVFIGITKTTGYSSNECDVPQDGLFPNCHYPDLGWQYPWFDISNTNLGNYFMGRFNDQTLGLHWSTFLGASTEFLISENKPCIAVRSEGFTEESVGHIYITGSVPELGASDFPIENSGDGYYNQSQFGGGNQDMFISYFRVVGNSSALKWSTFYGGDKDENGFGLAIDSQKRLFATGWVNSANMQEEANWCTVPQDNTFPLCNDSGLNYMETDEIGDVSPRSIVVAFDKDSKLLWSSEFGMGPHNVGRALSVGNNKLFMAGHSEESWTLWDFNPNSNGDYYQPQLSLYRDGTMARFDIPTMLGVGINESVPQQKELLVYPNPGNDHVSIILKEKWDSQNKLLIYNSTGQDVQVVAISNGAENTQIDVSHLCNGIYYIVLQTNQSTQSCVFIKE
jgi:hypothetical protein